MFQISCKECRVEHPRSFYGCFVLGPFEAGQSLTIANTLRRTLLSDVPGLGMRSVEVAGAEHGFAPLQGVQESMLDLTLNLRQLVFRPGKDYDGRPCMAYLNVRGPGKVQARHLQLPPSVQCVDPDQLIATLMEDGELKLKGWVESGKNYDYDLPSQESLRMQNMQNMQKATEGNITGRFDLENILMPVQQVNYMIQSSDIWPKEQDVVLEIWTNGSVHPRQALGLASKQIIRLFSKVDRSVLWVSH